MLRSVVICQDTEMTGLLVALSKRSGVMEVTKAVDRYLAGYDLERFLRAQAPEVLFLSSASANEALEVIHGVEAILPGTPIAALDRRCDPSILVELMRAGVREFLNYHFDENSLRATVQRLRGMVERRPASGKSGADVYTFLPAKAGVGATTIGLNASLYLSEIPDSNVLLIDLDLNSGLTGFLLKLDNGYTIYDATNNASKLDEHLWPQLVARKGSLDALPAGRLDPNTRIHVEDLRMLVAFARRFYNTICIDLSGNLEQISVEAMRESKQVFLVTTPEIPALHLARRKLQLLQQMDFGEQVAVLLNRTHKRMLFSQTQIEKLLGTPVHLSFSNDYYEVQKSVGEGRAANPKTDLGSQFAKLAEMLARTSSPAKPAVPQKKFIEFFSTGHGEAASSR